MSDGSRRRWRDSFVSCWFSLSFLFSLRSLKRAACGRVLRDQQRLVFYSRLALRERRQFGPSLAVNALPASPVYHRYKLLSTNVYILGFLFVVTCLFPTGCGDSGCARFLPADCPFRERCRRKALPDKDLGIGGKKGQNAPRKKSRENNFFRGVRPPSVFSADPRRPLRIAVEEMTDHT